MDSAKAESMLDAAEQVLRDEGYAALTSRRVAEILGVKQRLIYYYFRTMDELILAAFKRLAIRDLNRLKAGIQSERPLHEVWDVCINTTDARLISEFMALANHHEGVRTEVISFIEESRKLQIAALKKAIAKSNIPSASIPLDAIVLIGTSLALTLNRESSLGVKKGHPAMKKLIKEFLDGLEA